MVKNGDKFDLAVIGSGPAGQRAAIQAAKLGYKVAIIERSDLIGGCSLHTGTIPSKTLRETVLYLTGFRQRGFYGRSYRVKQRIGMSDLVQRLDTTVRHEVDVIHHQLTRNGIRVIDGLASFVDPHTLSILLADNDELTITADKFVIATGTRPVQPEGIPFDGVSVVDSDGILEIKEVPRSMLVVGAGVIGVEYATIFSALDTEITLVDGRSTMLDFLDKDIVDTFTHNLRDRGINIRLSETVDVLEKGPHGCIIAHFKSGKKVKADVVLYAAGREGTTDNLKLENAGLQADDRKRLTVDEKYCTDVPHIYAAGDVIGFPALASTSMEQGRLAARNAFGRDTSRSGSPFPFGIYAVPEMSMVGATEQELRDQGVRYEIGEAWFRETARGQILGLREGLLKLIFSLDDRRLLGCHIVGEGATELVHIGQAALILGGTLEYFVDTVFNYPTLAEAYKIAALDAWNRIA